MAVDGIGLSRTSQDSQTYGSIRIMPGTLTEALFLKWHSMYADKLAYVDVALSWRAVGRGDGPGGDGYGDWERSDEGDGLIAWYYKRFQANDSQLWHSGQDADGPGVWWSVPLDFASTDATTTDFTSIVQRICGGDWSYSARRYDAIELHVKIRQWWRWDESSEPQAAPLAEADLYVGYVPDYHPSSARMTPDGLALAYTSPGWARSSDRWALDGGLLAGGRPLVAGKVWGSVTAAGLVVVPSEALLFDPSGLALSGSLRMNATWRPIDMPFASMTLDGLTVPDERVANTPTVRATRMQIDGTVTVTVGDSGDRGVPLSQVQVRLVGGGLPQDVATLQPGHSHDFALPPLGEPTTWEAVGWSASGARSQAARVTCAALPAPGMGVRLEPTDGGRRATALYNVEWSDSSEPERQTVKLAGRQRPSAFYGEGGSVSRTLEFDVYEADAPGVTRQDASDFAALALSGDAMVRSADGSRAVYSVASASVTRGYDTRVAHVTLTLEEVGG